MSISAPVVTPVVTPVAARLLAEVEIVVVDGVKYAYLLKNKEFHTVGENQLQVVDQRLKNKCWTKLALNLNVLRLTKDGGNRYAVLPSNRIISLSRNNAGTELFKQDTPKRRWVLQNCKPFRAKELA